MRRLGWALLLVATACTDKTAKRAHALIRVEPAKVDFGTLAPGKSSDSTLTVFNDGSVALVISSAAIQGDARGTFSLSAAPASIESGGREALTVTYAAPAQE